ncbi:MAG: hypothetical protein US25_C0039G0003 [Candidatus Moranbacteria bacterium GW2011_GWE1_36_7]|nr:MAG: hypothetical protein UR99_C0053G0003 [Candidatus Moranbacteria bacterium GW2011_GWD2_36_12]KKQ04753.1 MAG: hypothetical protein US16_C0049G0003 [Candidatus Moranbacteria bacterium GW2011_GWE2_36_40]KKQ13543.1 MAG: hypothetical protein US25_C0039G0003 [Candidatus Moranbacteria bacterium GW2011_GWE1_36_7]
MLDFISSQITFYLTLVLVLFVPGIFLIIATKTYKNFSMLELFVLAFGSSIVIIDFMLILLGRFPFNITRFSIIASIAFFSLICWAFHLYWKKKTNSKLIIQEQIPEPKTSKRSTLLIILILFLTIFIKTIYFKDAIFPTSTDLGHHMYWAKSITITEKLPIYEKAEISIDSVIEKPTPIADFIIGEHLIFAAIAIISGIDFFSTFPVLTLFAIHIMTILSVFVLSRSLFKNSEHSNTISIATLLFIGPLFAIASPQAKFISGGVIGNDIGNLFIPLIILLFFKALEEKKSSLLAFALFLSLGLAYTHHLSTFVFIFILLFTIIAYTALNFKKLPKEAYSWLKMCLSPSVLTVLIVGAIFVFVLYTPTYLNTSAIDTAVGAPSKSTRTGLTLTQLKSTAGEARFAFAFIGVIALFFAKNLGKYNQAFLLGWMCSLVLMSLKPDLLFIDIPSNRIASYVVYPIAIIAAYLFVTILGKIRSETQDKNYLRPAFLLITFFLLMTFVVSNGFYDNAQSLNAESSSKKALQTYNASEYLEIRTSSDDVILKDHNYLSGDAWIKLFFMRGYSYPLSRGFFKRYEDSTKLREQCTNLMISSPTENEADKCFTGTKTNFIMINPKMDSEQFYRSDDFWQVYSGDAVGIFYKAQ